MRCWKPAPEYRMSLLPRRVIECCKRRDGHAGPHRSSTREWNDKEKFSTPRKESR